MTELYSVSVISKRPIAQLPDNDVVDAGIVDLAQRAKWKDIAGFKKDARKGFERMVAELKAETPVSAAKRFPPKARLNPLALALRDVALERAGHGKPPAGDVVEIEVRTISADVGMPDHQDPFRKLDTFILRLLADASSENAITKRFDGDLSKLLRTRTEDLWDFKMKKPAKANGKQIATTVTVVADTEFVRHVAEGATYASTAFEDRPAGKYSR